MGNIDTLLTCTGTLNPDATGTFTEYGDYEGKRYYRHSTGGFFLWWDGVDTWNISILLGVVGAGYWDRTNPSVLGLYAFQGTATGAPTIAPF